MGQQLDPVKVAEIILACQRDGAALDEMARLTRLPVPVVAGCADVLDGTAAASRQLDDDREAFVLYVAGQRMADAYFLAYLDDGPAVCRSAAPQPAA